MLACAELEETKEKYALQLALNKEAEGFAHKVHLNVVYGSIFIYRLWNDVKKNVTSLLTYLWFDSSAVLCCHLAFYAIEATAFA